MIDLELRLLGRGWLEARLTGSGQDVSVLASYLGNAPAELAGAVLLLLAGSPSSRCVWQDEPGSSRWLFEREGDRIHLMMRVFPDAFSHRDDECGKLIFQGEDTLRRFASRLRQELQYFLATLGAEEFEREWGHPFPFAEYQRLEQWLADTRS